MYEDKLAGKIDEGFWTRKMNDWRQQERQLQGAVERLSLPQTSENALSAQRILELANKAYSLYFTRNHAERGQLLKTVLLNCVTDNEEWSGREDLNLRPPGPEPGALPG